MKRAYIIEDDAIARLTLQKMLAQEGYATSAFSSNGESALEWLQGNVCDLLLIDLSLDGQLDGWETARQIRSYSSAPVIFCSSGPPTADILHDNLPFLPKPYAPEHLSRLLRQIQNQERLLQKALKKFDSKRILDLLYDLNGVAFCVTDIEGRYVQVNQTFMTIFGAENPEKVLGRSFLDNIPEKFKAENWDTYQKTMRGEISDIPRFWTVLNNDGEVREIWLNSTIAKNAQGEVYKFTTFLPIQNRQVKCIEHDSNFIESLYQRIQIQYEELSNLLFGHTQQLLQRNEHFIHFLQILFKLRTLSLAREQGSGNLDCNLGLYLRQLSEQLQPVIARQKLNFEFHIDCQPYVAFPRLLGFGLITAELLLNACRHAFDKPVPPKALLKLTLSQDAENQSYTLRVCDNGKGLRPDFNPEIHGSTGMQLLRNLSEQGNLKFVYENTLDQGTCFSLTWHYETTHCEKP